MFSNTSSPVKCFGLPVYKTCTAIVNTYRGVAVDMFHMIFWNGEENLFRDNKLLFSCLLYFTCSQHLNDVILARLLDKRGFFFYLVTPFSLRSLVALSTDTGDTFVVRFVLMLNCPPPFFITGSFLFFYVFVSDGSFLYSFGLWRCLNLTIHW